MNTRTIAETQSAWRRRHDNTGQLRDAHTLPTATRRAADETGGAPRPRGHHHRPGYRVRPGHLLITGLTIADRVITPAPPLGTTAARQQRDAAAYLDDIAREPNPFTSHLLNPAAGAGRGRIDVRHRRSPT